jgi:hypothetical protein
MFEAPNSPVRGLRILQSAVWLSTILAQARKHCGEVLPKSRYRAGVIRSDPIGIIGAKDCGFVARRDVLLAATMTAVAAAMIGCALELRD